MNNDDFQNMIKEHLAGIEKNTQKTADILYAAKQIIISLIAGLAIYSIMKYFGWAP